MSRNDSQEPSVSSGRICKAARATLILIPLLGLQYFMTPFRPEHGTDWEPCYQIVSAVVVSGQVTTHVYVLLVTITHLDNFPRKT